MLNFLRNIQGNVMVPGAIMLVAIAALGGSAIDMALVQNQKVSLQDIADQAALAAAKEYAVIADDAPRIEAVASALVQAKVNEPNTVTTPVADLNALTVDVEIKAPVDTFFPGPMSRIEFVTVSATAQLTGEAGNVCMIALSDSVKEAISMNQKSRLTAQDCAIYSNSTDTHSMFVNATADIAAEDIYLAGGFKGISSGTLKAPVTDAPPIADPLASRPLPVAGTCDFTNYVVTGAEDLSAGTYCGGLTIDGGAAKLFAGDYIIKDGPLTVMNGGTLDGDYVGFFLTGADAKLDFAADSSIDLSAPKAGDLTGLLFFSDASNPTSTKEKAGTKVKGGHVIRSDDARRLVGTIYLPDDKLIVDGDTPVADLSEYTVIIAKAFELNNGPNLVLQTDYAASDIPVPEGVGPVGDIETRLLH